MMLKELKGGKKFEEGAGGRRDRRSRRSRYRGLVFTSLTPNQQELIKVKKVFLLQYRKRFLLNGFAEAVDKCRDHGLGRRLPAADSDIRAAPPLPQAFAVGLVVK